MEGIAGTIVSSILTGGTAAVLAILIAIIVYLGYTNHQQNIELKEFRKLHDANIMEILEKYHRGQVSLIEAFNELKLILTVLKERG